MKKLTILIMIILGMCIIKLIGIYILYPETSPVPLKGIKAIHTPMPTIETENIEEVLLEILNDPPEIIQMPTPVVEKIHKVVK